MPPREPTASDFPAHVQPLIAHLTPPLADQTPTNILILLHGLGDTPAPFANLATSLRLPHTACLVLRGPSPLPFDLGGWHWGDDIQFDPARPDGGMDLDTGFSKSVRLLVDDVVRGVLLPRCGYAARQIHLFGYGQGGMAALAAARSLADVQLGGVVSVGGPLPESATMRHAQGEQAKKSATPVLVCHGSSRSAVTSTKAREVKEAFQDVQIVEWKKAGDGMMQDVEEMTPVMRFWARRLLSPAPLGTVEVGT